MPFLSDVKATATLLNYEVKVLFNWPSLYTNHEEKYR